MTPDVHAVLVTAQQLDGLLATTRGLARTGQQLDRPGLDRDIAVLCLAALRLQKRNRQACRLALLLLQQRVEILHQALQAGAALSRRGDPGIRTGASAG
ncbi:hypothetical protein [Teichococcus vastitatis]|jgi:hypothetical protein|uniref:Uncharacterized protein n=1 Tax=Teichococcus vastitatis TaxID=2307076 RepID=A0ABS9W1Z1_9PROT|nr:hypothetical protein [Pseudoroseomonas vastitatis]MCI0753316.1 hypothetical protein [Pseudoroseomonas vastitatis]